LRPSLNKVLSPDFAGLCSGEFIIFRKVSHLENRYLQYFLNSADFVSFASHLNAGDRPRVNFDQLVDYPFPLPPLPEQYRIVAEIEKQFIQLDAGVAALKRVQANLKRYRASVLKAACEGRLALQDPADEPAGRLLARILAERRAKWEAEHPGKKYVEPAAPVTDGLSALPVGWCWARIGDIFDVTIGGTPSRSKAEYWAGDVPWVSSGEVAFNRIKATRGHITREGLANSNAKLHPPGTVLLAMIGEGRTRGQAAILEIAATTNQNIASLLVSETQILSGWIFYWLESRYEETRKSGSGGMQYALNSGRIKDFVCPVPPLLEQHRIVAEVERRLSVVAALEATVAANLARAGRLRQAVLKRAFEGRLVAQDADNEPAEVLLVRIQTARTSVGA
jgi:type I restriction enzyme S subunit